MSSLCASIAIDFSASVFLAGWCLPHNWLGVSLLRSSNNGHFSCPYSSRTALHYRLKTVLLCPWHPSQGPGPLLSNSKLCYNRQSANMSSCPAPIGAKDQNLITSRQLWVCCCGVPYLLRGRLSFTIAAGPPQHSYSSVRVHDHILLS
jgi:hypothetical protein